MDLEEFHPSQVKRLLESKPRGFPMLTANLRTKIPDFRGFDSSRVVSLRVGISRPVGNFPESLSQRILGMILVGICVRIYIYIYVYMYINIYIHIYIYIERERERDWA